jgi:hypothetical protein
VLATDDRDTARRRMTSCTFGVTRFRINNNKKINFILMINKIIIIKKKGRTEKKEAIK